MCFICKVEDFLTFFSNKPLFSGIKITLKYLVLEQKSPRAGFNRSRRIETESSLRITCMNQLYSVSLAAFARNPCRVRK